MSAVAMPVTSRRGAAGSRLRLVPTGPAALGEGPQVRGEWYVDGNLAGDLAPLETVPARAGEPGVAGEAGAAGVVGVAGVTGWRPGARAGLRAVRAGERRESRPLRLTQRGRLTRTLVAFAALCLLALLAVARLTAPAPLVADHATTVLPGQTLSDIAAEQLPTRPVAEGVQVLRELNQMSSSRVVAGQSILLPAE
ncbi:LysM peptidoglycan-binding domain-containing protein [Piscicoccus intestinalis]|uniref:LysM peptidoglycan-binding domain-containing protein n=1 Tax=Piscicoccus intestinalis TaxID=746033 RepID=UPI00146FF4E0|nr:LysM peptidoglycan-binding domain-containing protein [Piscicoccus intestinalis]